MIITKIELVFSITLLALFTLLNLLNWKYYLYLAIIVCFLYLVIFLIIYQNTKINNWWVNGKYAIIKNYKNGFIININNNKVWVKANISLPDIYSQYQINLIGTVKKYQQYTNFNYANNVYLKLVDIQIISKPIPTNLELNYFKTYSKIAKEYLMLILFNKYDRDAQFINILKDLNIMHYFAISGFHFGLIYFIFSWIFLKFKINQKVSNLIILAILFIYLNILKFPIGATRAFLFLIFVYLNKNFFKNKFKSLTLLCFTAILILIFNPFSFLSYSFILSFTVTLNILLTNKIINFKQHHWIKYLLIIFIAYLTSLFISLSFLDKVNGIGFAYQLLFMPITFIGYSFSLFFFWSKDLTYWYFLIFNAFINFLDRGKIMINSINLNFFAYLLTFTLLFISLHQTCKIKLNKKLTLSYVNF
nr:ComEC/Rec2 family competence protein [Metamycoplasma neophronis]